MSTGGWSTILFLVQMSTGGWSGILFLVQMSTGGRPPQKKSKKKRRSKTIELYCKLCIKKVLFRSPGPRSPFLRPRTSSFVVQIGTGGRSKFLFLVQMSTGGWSTILF